MTAESKLDLLSTLSIRLPDRLESLIPDKQGVVEVLIPEKVFLPHSPETSVKYRNEKAYVVFVSGKFVLIDARGQSLDPITTKAYLKFFVLKDRERAFIAVLEGLKPSKQGRDEYVLSSPIHDPNLTIAWANQTASGVILYRQRDSI